MKCENDVVIVGAGLAGLACARELISRGLTCLVLEASDGIGGRARTDELNGFLLDRGFQVLLTSYSEAQRVLNYAELKLHSFEPGALIRSNGAFHRVADPWRVPRAIPSTLVAPIGNISDKIKLGKLRRRLISHHLTGGPANTEVLPVSTLQYLRNCGFSEEIIDRFFRPFIGGIFLELGLDTSSTMFEFVFRMFSIGKAVLPEGGMQAIAAQLAAGMPKNTVRLGQRCVRAASHSVTLKSGTPAQARAVVIATDQTEASELLTDLPNKSWCGTICLYFSAGHMPMAERLLVLNGDGSGPINHLCVPNTVSSTYAPRGRHLISANVIGASYQSEEHLLTEVRKQLVEWFGVSANDWEHLRSYVIPKALPEQPPATSVPARVSVDGVYVCGDFCETSSIEGALVSGRKTAEAVANSLGNNGPLH